MPVTHHLTLVLEGRAIHHHTLTQALQFMLNEAGTVPLSLQGERQAMHTRALPQQGAQQAKEEVVQHLTKEVQRPRMLQRGSRKRARLI